MAGPQDPRDQQGHNQMLAQRLVPYGHCPHRNGIRPVKPKRKKRKVPTVSSVRSQLTKKVENMFYVQTTRFLYFSLGKKALKDTGLSQKRPTSFGAILLLPQQCWFCALQKPFQKTTFSDILCTFYNGTFWVLRSTPNRNHKSRGRKKLDIDRWACDEQ